MNPVFDATDRRVLNRLQDGFPLCERPFLVVAKEMGLAENDLIARVTHLRESGVVSRFGPLFNVERAGGAVTLAAMKVPDADVEVVAEKLNAMPEVAHNYLRDHRFNLWFVLAAETQHLLDKCLCEIELRTGYPVYSMPKLSEYFLDLRLDA